MMRGHLGSIVIGAILGSVVTYLYAKNDGKVIKQSKMYQAKSKKAINFLQNMGEDLVRR